MRRAIALPSFLLATCLLLAIPLHPWASAAEGDADDDGLPDAAEAVIGTDPNDPDSDDDGQLDGVDLDANGDGIDDLTDFGGAPAQQPTETPAARDVLDRCDDPNAPAECQFPVDIPVSPDDRDGDGIQDEDEAEYGTDPREYDSDGDGLDDGFEVYSLLTDPLNPDTDGDGLADNVELVSGPEYGNWANLYDSDNDGLSDGEEADLSTTFWLPDTDGDGALDGYEVDTGSDPLDPADFVPTPQPATDIPGCDREDSRVCGVELPKPGDD